MRLLAAMILGVMVCSASALRAKEPGRFIIKNVHVFDGMRVLPSATVTVEGGVITRIDEERAPPASGEVIDGAGQTLVPGLIDAHAHAWNENHLRAAIVFGVTTEL